MGSEIGSAVSLKKSTSIAVIIDVDIQYISSSSSFHASTSDGVDISASIDTQTNVQLSLKPVSIVHVLSSMSALSHFLSTVAGYCRIGRNEISDLLKSGKKFIDRNNDEERLYERKKHDVTVIKNEVKRTIIVRRSTRISGLITAF